MHRSVWFFVFAVAGIVSLPARAEEKGEAFFESKVRPLLVEQCFDCHSGEEPESGLQADSLAGLLKGGLRGPAIIPGKAEESLLIRALRHGEQLKMPPKTKLKTNEIAAIARWIELGAPWPNAEPLGPAEAAPEEAVEFTEEQRRFWAFQPPQKPPLPAVQNAAWVHSPIDAFILAKLEEAGLSPAPQADRGALLRRATFDLIGLPPTPEELEAFLADDSPDAFTRVVDRLLASPQYGERWGRHWLDVARYSDSNGLDENLAYANAFRYRDYVVAAFNRDKPYDAFVREQIAGDLLESEESGEPRAESGEPDESSAGPDALPGSPPSALRASLFGSPPSALSSPLRRERLAATGILCLGAKMLAEDDPVKLQMDIIDEQVDTVGRAFLGLTLGCARCHDHKFDPIPTADYYSLAGVFKSTKTMDTFTVVARWQERPLESPEAIAARDAAQKEIDKTQAEINRARGEATAAVLSDARRHAGDYVLAALDLLRERRLLESTPPLGEQLDGEPPDGVILLEAENFDRGNVLRDTTNYGQGIGVLVNQGPTPNFVEYDVEIPRSGKHRFEVRYAAASSRPCSLFINGAVVKSDVAGGVTGSWFPDSQRWEVEGLFPLSPGKVTLRLEHPQFFPHIDKLLLAPAPDEPQSPAVPPLDSEYALIPEFVQQWAAHIERSKETPNPWFPPSDASPDELRKFAEQLGQQAPVDSADGPFAAPQNIESRFPAEIAASLESLRRREKELQEKLPHFPQAMAVSENPGEDLRIHYRGSHLTLGAIAPRRFPRILAGDDQPAIGPDRSGRLELANWLTRPDHPLTARVFVNRVWHWRFGKGLVRSPDNFGRLGERPTHPELLDWLAVHFVESGWSVKELHRMMLLSSTWQQSSSDPQSLDLENLLWHRMPRRRLPAEAIRDSILAVAGKLDLAMGGSLLPTPNRQYVTSTANVDPVVYESNRRSIYLPVVRSALYDVFQVFDFAEPSVSTGERQTTTIAPQALFMMNSQLVADATKRLAERLLAEREWDDAQRVKWLWLTAYTRPPRTDELQLAIDYVRDYQILEAGHADVSLRAWQSLCRAVIGANEFIFVE